MDPGSTRRSDGLDASRASGIGARDGLVEAAIAGDEAARRSVWASRRSMVGAILLARGPREAELEDLMQDVAAQFVAGIGSLREAAAIDAWLRQIALNTATASGRKATVRRNARGRLSAEARSRADSGVSGVDYAARDEAHRVLDAALDLPESYREPLILRCVRGMTTRQIAKVMGVAPTTVETRVARARRMLRERLERMDAEGSGRGADQVSDAQEVVR